jgi:hypothetical protein
MACFFFKLIFYGVCLVAAHFIDKRVKKLFALMPWLRLPRGGGFTGGYSSGYGSGYGSSFSGGDFGGSCGGDCGGGACGW